MNCMMGYCRACHRMFFSWEGHHGGWETACKHFAKHAPYNQSNSELIKIMVDDY